MGWEYLLVKTPNQCESPVHVYSPFRTTAGKKVFVAAIYGNVALQKEKANPGKSAVTRPGLGGFVAYVH